MTRKYIKSGKYTKKAKLKRKIDFSISFGKNPPNGMKQKRRKNLKN